MGLHTKLSRISTVIWGLLIACCISLSPPSLALEAPKGDIVLVIDGNIKLGNTARNGKPVAEFDLNMLKALGSTSITTSTPWTDISDYTGVRLDTLLASVGANPKTSVIRATAVNDYWFDLQQLKMDSYPIIVAYERNGQPMSLRELGPLWVMFPWDQYPELLTAKNKASSVWQLIGLTVK